MVSWPKWNVKPNARNKCCVNIFFAETSRAPIHVYDTNHWHKVGSSNLYSSIEYDNGNSS